MTEEHSVENDAAWQAELEQRERTLHLARRHAVEQGFTEAAWHRVYNAEDSIRAWKNTRVTDETPFNEIGGWSPRVIPPAKPADLDDPIDEYRQAQLERSNQARGIVR